jgi:hypothetical protein
MLALMNRSIDLMEVLADKNRNIFRMNRRGYLYLTADKKRASDLGAGPLHVHSSSSLYYQRSPKEGFRDQPTGSDLLLGNELIRNYFPYVTNPAVATLHVRRAAVGHVSFGNCSSTRRRPDQQLCKGSQV